MKDINEIIKFYKQLKERGVQAKATDDKGRNALHLAARSQNLAFIKYLIDVEHFDPNLQDSKGRNLIATLICGDLILTAKIEILKYLLGKPGCDLNHTYLEKTYGDNNYRCTPVIHSIRHPSKDRTNIKLILKELLERGANPIM